MEKTLWCWWALRKYSNKEEYQRSAVGRYYYACYLVARDIYNIRLKRPNGESISHYALIDFFEKSKSKKERELGKILRELKNFRNNADYDVNFNVDNASISKEHSKLLLSNFKEIEK